MKAQELAFDAVRDVVFDLDWTLFYPVDSKIDSSTVLLPEGAFHLADGALEVMLELHRKGYRVSIFSGGEKARNEALAQFIVEELRKKGAPDFRFYKILNKEHLSRRANVPENAKFSETWMKDLRKINSDLSRVLMVDDSANFIVPGQEKNLYWIEKTYNFQKVFSNQVAGPYDPPTRKKWRGERRKIITFGEKLLGKKILRQNLCQRALLN